MDAILNWLNDPLVKYLLALVGGFLLKKWPEFANRAIPLVTLVMSAILAILAAMFPVTPAGAAEAVGAAAASVPWWKWIIQDILLPVILAWGTQSGIKNSVQWVGGGAKLMAKP